MLKTSIISVGPGIPRTHGGGPDIVPSLLESIDTFATPLVVLVADRYGLESLSWHPTTLRMQLEQDFGVKLPVGNLDKLMAGATLVTTNYFYRSLSRFLDLAQTISGGGFTPQVVALPDVAECSWAMTEALLLSPPEEPYVDDIKGYLSQVLVNEGFIRPPAIMRSVIDKDQPANYAFEDDPEMYEAVWQTQSSKTGAVDQMLRENLQELLVQLESLPLENGDATEFLRKARQSLGRA